MKSWLLKKYLYNRDDEKSFFYGLEQHLFNHDYKNFSSYKRFLYENQIKLVLPACYFGHLKILEWLLDHGHDVNEKNNDKESGLHLGNITLKLVFPKLQTILSFTLNIH